MKGRRGKGYAHTEFDDGRTPHKKSEPAPALEAPLTERQEFEKKVKVHYLTIGGKSMHALIDRLRSENVKVTLTDAERMEDIPTEEKERSIVLFEVTPEALGFTEDAWIEEVIEKAARRGLTLVPQETAIHWWLMHHDSLAENGSLIFCSEPFAGSMKGMKDFAYIHRNKTAGEPRRYVSFYSFNEKASGASPHTSFVNKVRPKFKFIFLCDM